MCVRACVKSSFVMVWPRKKRGKTAAPGAIRAALSQSIGAAVDLPLLHAAGGFWSVAAPWPPFRAGLI